MQLGSPEFREPVVDGANLVVVEAALVSGKAIAVGLVLGIRNRAFDRVGSWGWRCASLSLPTQVLNGPSISNLDEAPPRFIK
jgi:hypothetical protein